MRSCVLDTNLYPVDCVEMTVREFASLCTVTVSSDPNGQRLDIDPRTGAPPETADEFLNYLLCAAVERHLARA